MSKSTDFATSLTELENVVAELDSDVPIEKALVLFERGMQLSNECEKFLTAAEQKVEILKKSASGTMTVETLSVNIETGEVS
jgi:exodeoxyribonuclease VII small subunit